MADEVDLANDLIDSEVSRALGKIRKQTLSKGQSGSKICVECGENIPEGRRNLGYVYCVSCAEELERRGSLFAE